MNDPALAAQLDEFRLSQRDAALQMTLPPQE